MSDVPVSPPTPLAGPRWMALAAGAVLTLVLAACSSAASTASSASPTPSPSPTPSASPTPSPSPSGIARCGVTPNASPSATITVTQNSIGTFFFSAPVTIKAGQAVVFTIGNLSPQTITEGTYGVAAANACVDVPLANSSSVIVSFWQKGSYQITSTQHAPEMKTSVLVK